MKEIISYLYQLNIEKEELYNEEIIYTSSNSSYLYKEVDDINKILFIDNYIKKQNTTGFYSYIFKNNIYGEVISHYNDKKFILLEIGNNYQDSIDFEDMLSFYKKSLAIKLINNDYENKWYILWENKIDYLYNHFHNNYHNNKEYEVLFNYYISVTESLLLYINNVKKIYQDSNKVTIVHRRVLYPITKISFYNPLNFIIDLEVRDIGEYIKSLYYNNEDYLNYLDYYMKTNNIDAYTASMLYARIIYPSIFFDDYESNHIEINKYLNFDDYQEFAKKIYDLISSYIFIDKIDWLY